MLNNDDADNAQIQLVPNTDPLATSGPTQLSAKDSAPVPKHPQPDSQPLPQPASPAPQSPAPQSPSQPRKRLVKDFKFGHILGEGSYSTVLHARELCPPTREFAIKMLDKRHLVKNKKDKYATIERDVLNSQPT
ncbi:hypothetical protein BDK51DRAFT_41619 [Blyttiomyces helicus]|uniref:Protein kinase domain-containing protein n=1 Tax=Blyttiomyces helicus TaxID=388810 RepID=A0A4P9W3E5_9FUNG|nr:hypothetical protein BDK51DRAFT_41619 [Blyttiomyces helicus]|eukprot:RKO86839.1 hypothetical protein BDK51DRAFT_41619 [Blyttiomyces helicus]